MCYVLCVVRCHGIHVAIIVQGHSVMYLCCMYCSVCMNMYASHGVQVSFISPCSGMSYMSPCHELHTSQCLISRSCILCTREMYLKPRNVRTVGVLLHVLSIRKDIVFRMCPSRCLFTDYASCIFGGAGRRLWFVGVTFPIIVCTYRVDCMQARAAVYSEAKGRLVCFVGVTFPMCISCCLYAG